MTLSRFLRDYLYVPLGGNRKGPVRRYVNLLLTMLLGGLWHGAGLNFVIWGALHGIYLMINHGWHALASALRFPRTSFAWKLFATALTFASVCVAWVFFRAADVDKATLILQGMVGQCGIGVPEAIGNRLGSLRPVLEAWGISFYLGGGSRFLETWQWVLVAAGIAFLCPNSQQIMARYDPALGGPARPYPGAWQIWQPSRRWSLYMGAILFGSLLSLSRPAEFLYFQF